MKKKISLIAGLCLCAASLAMAEGLETQFGIGYHGAFFGPSFYTKVLQLSDASKESGTATTISALLDKEILIGINTPIGIGTYVGFGYGIGTSQDFSVGFEIAPSVSATTVSPLITNLGLQGRLFVKYGPSKLFSITGFGGLKGSMLLGGSTLVGGKPSFSLRSANPVFGIRITVSFFYLEHAVVTARDFSNIYSHDIGVGISVIND